MKTLCLILVFGFSFEIELNHYEDPLYECLTFEDHQYSLKENLMPHEECDAAIHEVIKTKLISNIVW